MTTPPVPTLWRIERAVIRTTERVGLYLIVQGLRVRGFITGKGIPS